MTAMPASYPHARSRDAARTDRSPESPAPVYSVSDGNAQYVDVEFYNVSDPDTMQLCTKHRM